VVTPKARPRTDRESKYFDVGKKQLETFPSLMDPAPQVYLSVIVPAYNETARLPKMLKDTIDHLEERRKAGRIECKSGSESQRNGHPVKLFSYEIIIVDDGSKDGTADVALDLATKYAKASGGKIELRVMSLEKNRGKGGAVTQVRRSESPCFRCVWRAYGM
jgi:dolichyl-phosphate beta-glucosyltransferase